MRSLKAHYFSAFAVIGSIMPFLPVYLAHLGFSKTEIGYINTVGAVAVVVTPALLALLADAHIQTRRLLCFVFLAGGAAFVAMLPVTSFWPVLVLYGIHCLAFAPALPLQDSLTFHSLHVHTGLGRSHPPYHRIRVWGSLGFMLPAVERDRDEPRAGLPTDAALKTLAEPHLTVFCLAAAAANPSPARILARRSRPAKKPVNKASGLFLATKHARLLPGVPQADSWSSYIIAAKKRESCI